MLGTQIHLYSNTFIKTFQLSQFRFNTGFVNKVRKLNMFTEKLGDYAIICYNTYGNIFCLNPVEIADLLDIPLHEVESLARGKSA